MLALVAALFILLILYIQPRVLGAAASHWAGRVLLVGIVALGGYVHPAVGVLAALAYIICADQREGMTVASFRDANCRSDPDGQRRLVDASDQNVAPREVNDTYPAIQFKGAECNPCDSGCAFDLLETEALVQGREIATSKPSATTPLRLFEESEDIVPGSDAPPLPSASI
tara:strand:+ start:634 stop:1146 length:513 start_codon:yes stop_codon:yes gene_type:complete